MLGAMHYMLSHQQKYVEERKKKLEESMDHAFSNEPIEGWRAWLACYVEDDGVLSARLRSVTYSQIVWPAREALDSVCLQQHSWLSQKCTPPEASHHCGIHVLKTALHVVRGGWGAGAPNKAAGVTCYGKVYIWGHVVEGTIGWRARYAYPEEIWIPDWRDSTMRYYRDKGAGFEFEPEEIRRDLSKEYAIPVSVGLPPDLPPEELKRIYPKQPVTAPWQQMNPTHKKNGNGQSNKS